MVNLKSTHTYWSYWSTHPSIPSGPIPQSIPSGATIHYAATNGKIVKMLLSMVKLKINPCLVERHSMPSGTTIHTCTMLLPMGKIVKMLLPMAKLTINYCELLFY